MRLGTPGFIGDRLKEAREARGLTQVALSELVQVTRQAVSQYESGSASPHPDVLERIAATLSLPQSFFFRPVPELSSGAIFYRSMSAATLSARVRAERRFGWLKEITDYLKEFVEFPDVDFPKLDVPTDIYKISDAHIEAAAEELREYWALGDGPLGNVVYLLENKGAITTRVFLGAETLDAFSHWRTIDGRPYVVLGADKQAAARSRFDAAHELGHLVLHGSTDQTILRKSAEFKLMEEQAHKFAGAFLLPEARFCSEFLVPTLEAMRVLKQKWKVSIGAMIMRASQLELLTEDQSVRLWRYYARRGWKRHEPLDDEQPPETPQLLRQSFELLISEGVQTREQILSELALNPSDVEELSGLPRGYLAEPAPTVRILSLPAAGGPRKERTGDGQVVPFARDKDRRR